MNSIYKSRTFLAVILLVLSSIGCGDDDPVSFTVSGDVDGNKGGFAYIQTTDVAGELVEFDFWDNETYALHFVREDQGTSIPDPGTYTIGGDTDDFYVVYTAFEDGNGQNSTMYSGAQHENIGTLEILSSDDSYASGTFEFQAFVPGDEETSITVTDGEFTAHKDPY